MSITRWRKGTLHAGRLDVERVLYRLNKKGLDLNNLKAKTKEYVDEGHLTAEQADQLLRHIEAERRICRETVDATTVDSQIGESGAKPAGGGSSAATADGTSSGEAWTRTSCGNNESIRALIAF